MKQAKGNERQRTKGKPSTSAKVVCVTHVLLDTTPVKWYRRAYQRLSGSYSSMESGSVSL